eukprot:2268777-Amphidinium_carterae.1
MLKRAMRLLLSPLGGLLVSLLLTSTIVVYAALSLARDLNSSDFVDGKPSLAYETVVLGAPAAHSVSQPLEAQIDNALAYLGELCLEQSDLNA